MGNGKQVGSKKSPVMGSFELPLSFESPESKLIARASYDPGTQVMTVYFAAGTCYTYGGIQRGLWQEFERASSKGNYFGKCIRPMYAGKLVV